MTNGLSVSDITPLGERPADIWRGRTGISVAGVDALLGIGISGTPADGNVIVYDAATDTWLLEAVGSAPLNTISPAQLVANTDNWNPTGLATADVIRVSTDASWNLTGLVAPTISRKIVLENVGAQPLVLKHDVTSTAANRFYCPTDVDYTVAKDAAVLLVYDVTSSRWRVIDQATGAIPSFATPAIVLGTAAAAGAATTVIRSDATIVAFDTSTPLVDAGSGSTGTAAVAARVDHVHPQPSVAGLTFLGARAYDSTTQTVASGVAAPLALDSENYDTSAFHFLSSANLTGTVAKNGTTAIVGTSTLFTTELSVNQVISIPGTTTEVGVVQTITDNTHLTLWVAMANTASGQTATRRSAFMAVPSGLGGNYAVSAVVRWTTVTTAKVPRVSLQVNTDLTSSVGTGIASVTTLTVTSGDNWVNPSATYRLVAGDTMAVVFVNNESGTVTLSTAGVAAPVLTLALVGV